MSLNESSTIMLFPKKLFSTLRVIVLITIRVIYCTVVNSSNVYSVLSVFIDKNNNSVIHKLDSKPSLGEGNYIIQIIDWGRRYRLTRLHTASHIISGLMHSELNALVTGGNNSVNRAYGDYSLETFNRELFIEIINKANRIVSKEIEVKTY